MGEVMAAGFPPFAGSATKAPFDILGDTLRGTKGVIVDMFRQPDKVIAAVDQLTQVAIDWALKKANPPEVPICFMPLHKGADGFMSDEQFRTFYWPSFLKVIEGLVEQGMIPLLFAEGRYNTRLEAIMETPKGSSIWYFDQTDMARAKETIGTVCCIQGNMPLSLLHAGTAEQVAEQTRKLIDVAGKDGGFILDVGAVADEGKDENLLAMVNTAKDYGKY
jgi:uroporphyrinogen-III decarboxylase